MENKKSTQRAKEKQISTQEKAVSPEAGQAKVGVYEVVFIRSRVMKIALQVLPWLSIVGLILNLKILTFWRIGDTVMFNSGLVVVIIGLFIFQILAKRASQVFITISKRNIIEIPDIGIDGSNSETSANRPASLLQIQYGEFMDKYEGLLNHPIQWVIGGIMAAMVFVWQEGILPIIAGYFRAIPVRSISSLVGVIAGLMQFVLAFVMGFLIWRMIVIGIYVWKLGKTFKINPQIGHPDSCGGLAPIGNLCLWNILLISLPAFYLGGWLLPSQLWQEQLIPTDPLFIWVQQSLEFSDLYPNLLLIPIAISIISFFVPLWSVHISMLKSRSAINEKMERLTQSITKIEESLLERANTMDIEQADVLLKRLKIMQEVYQQNLKYPTWPFNANGLFKFTTVQLVPLLISFGLPEVIVNVIKKFF